MKVVLLQAVLLLLLLIGCHESRGAPLQHFNGGSLSFNVVWNNATNKWQVKLDVITGWVLSLGPCGQNCTRASLNADTTASRLANEAMFSSPEMFGKWTIEYKPKTGGSRKTKVITNDIKQHMTGSVMALNTEAKWEQERMTVMVDLVDDADPKEKQDISFEGLSWHNLSFPVDSGMKWHLQSQVQLQTRSDTGRPNNSPVSLAKPFYRLKLNRRHKIYIPGIDPDEDAIKCQAAVYIEAGPLSSKDHLKGLDIYTDDEGRCVVDIDTSEDNGYLNDYWIAIAVMFRDYNTETVHIGSEEIKSFETGLSSTAVQFLAQVLEHIVAPEFIEPTEPPNHKFFVFSEASWTTVVYARASENVTISEFFLITRSGENITSSDPVEHPTEPLVKFITLSWKPTIEEKGSHLICVRATDSSGVDTEADRCFTIHVSLDQFNRTEVAVGRPYFIDLPTTPEQIGCIVDASCILPLFVKSDNPIDHISVRIPQDQNGDSSLKTNIGEIQQTNHNGQSVYKADLVFTHYLDGIKQFCLTAYDINNVATNETCVSSAIMPPDPCLSKPCANGGTCRRNPTNWVDFICDCLQNQMLYFYEKTCKKAANPCEPNPCEHSRLCIRDGIKPKCICERGYTGSRCEIDMNDCAGDPCGNGICVDGIGNHTCKCFSGYNGTDCTNDMCINAPTNIKSCPDNSGDCNNDTCNGHGICFPGPTCKCNSFYTGPSCNKLTSDDVGNLSIVPPTLDEGSKITCYFDSQGVKPCIIKIYVVSKNGPFQDVHVSRSSGDFVSMTTITPPRVESVSGIANLFSATVKLNSSTYEGKHFVCIKTTQGQDSDERCFEIVYIKDPLSNVGSEEDTQKNKSIKFVEPTPLAGSNLSCVATKDCHLLLYTTLPASGTCEKVLAAGDLKVGVFDPRPTDSVCETEVVYSLLSAGTEFLCFQAGSDATPSQKRCFIVESFMSGQDPCVGGPTCQNDGVCIHDATNQFNCICQKGFQGKNCETGQCLNKDNNCLKGYCSINDTVTTCLCPLGYSGAKCDKDIGTINPDAKETGAKFTDTTVPAVITCNKNRPCIMPFIVSGTLPAGEIPDIRPGFLSQGVTMGHLVTEPDPFRPGQFPGYVEFTSKVSGVQDVCLQTHNDKGDNTDEVCFKLNVTTDTSLLFGRKDKPYFVDPSLPAASTVRCEVDTTCHVIYKVYHGDGNENKCIKPSMDATDFSSLQINSTCDDCVDGQLGNNNCTIDIYLRPSASYQGTSNLLCVGLAIRGANTLGETGEHRCFTLNVESQTQISERGSCRTTICHNNGFCDGHGQSAVCYCTQGFTGDTCNIATKGNDSKNDQMSFVGDRAVPSEINCSMNETCVLPLQLFGLSGVVPTASLGYVDPRLDAKPPVMTTNSNGNTDTTVEISPLAPGPHTVCVQANNGSLVSEEVCVIVNVGNASENVDKTKAHFVSPTLPDESSVSCIVNNTCHIMAYYDKISNGTICPSLSLAGPHNPADTLHVFDTIKSSVCTNDILFTIHSPATRTLCLQLSSTGQVEEKRCFYVSAKVSVDEVTSPCTMVTCSNGGKCMANFQSDTPTSYCICASGFAGDNCTEVVASSLPGVTNLPSSLSPPPPDTPQLDATSGLPQTITCTPHTTCVLPVPYIGSADKPPVPGFVDPFIHLTPDPPVATPDNSQPTSHLLLTHFTPTKTGNHTLCMQTTVNGSVDSTNIDEICYNIVVENTASPSAVHDPPLPHFAASTYAKDTSILCPPNQVCHVHIQTEPDTNTGICAPVRDCGPGVVGLHVFEPQLVNGTCYTDVGYKTGASHNATNVCLSAGLGGEERNFQLKTQDIKEFGPCQTLHCENGGKCLADVPPARCFCTTSFEGDTCQTATRLDLLHTLPGVANMTSNIAPVHGFLSSTGLPSNIKCSTNVPCPLPLVFAGSTLPVLGYYSPSVHMNQPAYIINPNPGSNITTLATWSATATAPGNHTVCLQTTLSGTSDSVNVDEFCFTMETVDSPGKTPDVNKTLPYFHRSNLPEGSVVQCDFDIMCHVPFITEQLPNGQCVPLQRCDMEDVTVHVFQPHVVSRLCVTDVGFVTGNIESSTEICLSAGHSGENRTLTIKTSNITEYSPCQKLHCQNGGRCKGDTTPAKCICARGFSGETCDQVARVPSTLPGATNSPNETEATPHFDPFMTLPDHVTCVAGQPCTIPIPYTGQQDKPPQAGYHEPSLQVSPNPSVESPDPAHPGSHLLMTSLTPTQPGNHTLCVQTTQNGLKNGTNVDELCFTVDVVPPGTNLSSAIPGKPAFSPSSLTNGSMVTCLQDSVCHLPIITSKTDGSCYPVRECDAGVSGVHVFSTTTLQDGKCFADVGFKTGDQPQTTDLCIKAGPNGEERHFLINAVNKTEFSPCQKLHCENGGVCKGDTSPAKCICPPGTEGDTCKNDASVPSTLPGVTNAPTDTRETPHFNPKMILPEHVTCVAGQSCTFPIPFIGHSDKPPQVSYHEPSLQVSPDPIVESPDLTHPDSHLLMTSLTPTQPGNHTLCVQTTQDGLKNGTNVDELCFTVDVAPPGTVLSSVTPGQVTFSPSTLSSGSMVTCQLETVCHLPVITPKPSNGECLPVVECGDGVSGVHIFSTTAKGDRCFTNVGYRTGDQPQTTDLCIQAGPNGEERHFLVNTVNKTEFSPCQKLHCLSGGVCKGDTDPAKCVCPPGTHGDTCDKVATVPSTLPGVTNAPTDTVATPHFDPFMALPDHVTCVAGQPCTIPIPYTGNLTNPPVPGFTEPGLKVLPDPDVVTPNPERPSSHVTMTTVVPDKTGDQKLCFQTTDDGTRTGVNIDEVCVTISVEPKGSVSPTATPTKPSFLETSLPNGTTVNCLLNTVCHLLVVTEPKSNNTCEPVQECSPGLSGVHVFEAKLLDDQCYTNVAYKTGPTPDMARLCIKQSPDGEERQYTINTANKTAYGPCQSLHCVHGACNSISTTPECLCESGFNGTTCTESKNHDPDQRLPGVLNLPATTTTSMTPALSPNSGIPLSITCVTDTPCSLPLMYSGDKTAPPVTGYIDPTLGRSVNQSVVTPDPISPAQQLLLTTVTPTVPGNHTLCLHTTANGSKDGINIDAVCFNLVIADKNQGVLQPQVNQSLPHFHETNLPDGSVITCVLGTFCHLPVITEPVDGQCAPVQECRTSAAGLHPFQTRLVDNLCVTDVGYNTENTQKSTTVCITSGYNGEERNFTLEATNVREYSPCQKTHCEGGGVCKDDTSPAKCVCPSGLTGNTCNQNVTDYTNLPGVTSPPTETPDAPHFTEHAAVPSSIVCYVNKPCILPIQYEGNSTKPPVLGYNDPSVKVNLTPDVQSVSPTSHTLVTSLTPTSPGNHRVCVQTTADGTKTGQNVDEVCIQVSVSTGQPPVVPNPKFQEPTVPSGSTLVCQSDTSCHLPVITPTEPNGTCLPVHECGGGTSGVHVFEPRLVNGSCVTDVAYRTSASDNTADLCLTPGSSGEERHFTINTTINHEYGPCQKLHCQNGGLCLGKATGATCLCTAGFKGEKCEEAMLVNMSSHLPGVDLLPPITNSSHSFLANSGIPETIQCQLNQPCVVPIMYQGTKQLVNGYKGPTLSISPKELTPDPRSNETHVAMETVTPTETGNHTMCLQTTTTGDNQGLNLDEVCFTLMVSTPNGLTVNQSLPHFDGLTLSPGSTLTCLPLTDCHIPITTKPNTVGQCEPVTECGDSSGTAYVFPPKVSDGVCISDVVYTTGPSDDLHTLCLSSGPGGEERTFNIRTTGDRVYGPCQKLHCYNEGSCLGNTTAGTCVCKAGFEGQTCEIAKSCDNGGKFDVWSQTCVCQAGTSGDVCQYLHGETLTSPVNTSTDQTPPRFTDLFLPEVLRCQQDKPCEISIPVLGMCNQTPIVLHGAYSDELNVADLVTTAHSPVGGASNTTLCRYESIVSVTPTQTGTSSYCVQTADSQRNNADELCFQIDTQTPTSSNPTSLYVTPPTVPQNSVLACPSSRTCHTSIITQKTGAICEDLTLAHSAPSVNIFPPTDTGVSCKYDVAFAPSPNQTGNISVCVKLGSTQEERCITYDVKPETQIEQSSLCRMKRCENAGLCQSTTSTADCICHPGTSGDRCEIVESLDKIGSVPPFVNCTEGQRCYLVIPVFTSDLRPPVAVVTNGEANSTIVPPVRLGAPHLLAVDILPTSPRVCVNISTQNNEPPTQKCIEVNIQPANSSFHNTKFPENSIKYQCTPGESCVLSVVSNPDNNNNKCPSIRIASGTTMLSAQVFDTTPVQGHCVSEVVTSSTSEPGQSDRQLCVKVESESKCFSVTFQEPDQCSTGVSVAVARRSTNVGLTSCYCMVNDRKVPLINSQPVASPVSLLKSGFLGAACSGGVVALAFGAFMVRKLMRKSFMSSRRSLPPTPRPPSRVFPRPQPPRSFAATRHR